MLQESRYPYEMPPERKKAFLDSLRALRVGDSAEKVRQVLGSPFKEDIMRGKEMNQPVRGFHWTYYVKRAHPLLINERTDEYFLIVFSSGRTLVDKGTNVAGISLWDDRPSTSPMDRGSMPSTRRGTTTAVGR